MKNLSAISKKGIILVSAVIMIMAGAFVALLPSTSRACGHEKMGKGTSYVHVPILNNTGETLTIRSMFIDTPNVTNVWKGWSGSKEYDDELRVKAISFGGTNYYTAASTGHSHCHKHASEQDIIDKTIDHDDYTFSGTKVECKIAFDVIQDELPSGTYTIRYYFRYSGDTEDRMNTVSFDL